jgi:hypothetical protein
MSKRAASLIYGVRQGQCDRASRLQATAAAAVTMVL